MVRTQPGEEELPISPPVTFCPKQAGRSLQAGDTEMPSPNPEESDEVGEEDKEAPPLRLIDIAMAAAADASIALDRRLWRRR